MKPNENDNHEVVEEGLKDVGIGGFVKSAGKTITQKQAERAEKKYKKAKERARLQTDDEFSKVQDEIKEAVSGSLPITLSINSVATVVGPAVLLFVVDLDKQQFAIMLSMIVANAVINVLASFLHVYNNKKTANSVGKSTYYLYYGRQERMEADLERLSDENVGLKEDIARLKKMEDEYAQLKFDDKVRTEVEKQTNGKGAESGGE